ncbi:MAG: MBL fold metallo-hydrolase [Betaproteobacteria bacterium]
MTTSVRFIGSGDSFGSGGRFQTCIMVEADGQRCLLDCGASSLVAMRAQGIDPNGVDTILLTHFHGDHCGGVPFLIMDAMLASKRTRRLVVGGPQGVRARMNDLREALFPGSRAMKPRFELEFVELVPRQPMVIGGLTVTAFPAMHTPETSPTMLRVQCGGKVITYSGDTDWTDALPQAADAADLLIMECYYYAKPIKMHMNYATLRAHREELNVKALVLTHMSEDMLSHAGDVDEKCAADGMIISL